MVKRLVVTGYKAHELGIFNDSHPGIPIIKQAIKNQLLILMDEGLESSHPATPETTCSNTCTTTKLECLCSLPKVDRTLEENITLLKFKEMFLYIQQERAYKCPFAEMISIDVLSSNFKETDPTEVFLLEKENFLSELENVL